MTKKKKLEDSDGLKELGFLKQWADRSIVCPPDYGTRQGVDNAYKILKSKLDELKKYKQKIKDDR